MLILYDTAHAKLCALTNYSDLFVEQTLGSGSNPIVLDQLHFKYPLEDKNNSKIDYECYIGTEDAEYVVKEISLQTADSGITWVEYICDQNVEPLKGTLIENFAPGSVKPDVAANLALAGTGWTVGFCDVTRRRTAAKTNCTVFEALGDIASAYACEITFDTLKKLVHIHQKQGADRGAYAAEQLNLKQLQVQGNSRSYITRLFPRGKDGLTIADINNEVLYVSNYQYSTKIVEAYWIDNRYTNASELKADAEERLNYLSKPTRAYSATIIDLARVSVQWSLLDFQLGDWITLISESTGVREQQRIVKIRRYPNEPEKSTIEIANKLSSLDDIILRVSDAADTVSDATDSTGAIQGSAVQISNPDGTYSSLNAAVAHIGTLIATKAEITDLTAANARIDNLTVSKVGTDYLQANYIKADSIQSTYATISNLNAAAARITTLETNQITTNYLNTHYANIDLANISAGAIKTAMIDTGAVGTAQIANGSITDAKIVGLTANKITAGTIDASKITVTNLDCANLTVGTINGQQIASGAIDTSKLASALNSTINTASSNASSALSAAATAQTTANGKNTAYYGSTQPTSPKAGDLWFKPAAGGIQPQQYNGNAWISITDTVAATANTNAASAQTAAAAAQSTANNATTAASTAQTTANNAASAATTAQTTANGKNTAYYQTAAPSGGTYKVNDIWYDTDDGYKMYYYNGTAWTAAALGNSAIATLDAGKITTGYLAAARIAAGTITGTMIYGKTITAAQIAAGTITSASGVIGALDAGSITTGTLAAARIGAGTITGTMISGTTITAANIAANTITASQIAAGTITATQIASRTITADRIVAGAITASEIASHTITANQLAVGTITAASGIIGSIDASKITTGILSADRIDTANLKATKIYSATDDKYLTLGSYTIINSDGTTSNLSGAGFYQNGSAVASIVMLQPGGLAVCSDNSKAVISVNEPPLSNGEAIISTRYQGAEASLISYDGNYISLQVRSSPEELGIGVSVRTDGIYFEQPELYSGLLSLDSTGKVRAAVEGTDYGVRRVTLWSGEVKTDAKVTLSDNPLNYKFLIVETSLNINPSNNYANTHAFTLVVPIVYYPNLGMIGSTPVLYGTGQYAGIYFDPDGSTTLHITTPPGGYSFRAVYGIK